MEVVILPLGAPDMKDSYLNGGIAQLVERQLCKLDVRGSNPLASTLGLVAQLVELTLDKRAVTGSSPVWPTGKRQLW